MPTVSGARMTDLCAGNEKGGRADSSRLPKLPGSASQGDSMRLNQVTMPCTDLAASVRFYTTLGLLKVHGDPAFPLLEFLYLKLIHRWLTLDWYQIQSGIDEYALAIWHEILQVLELDIKARRDLLLLAHSGIVGRTKANELLWNLLSIWALDNMYLDLSHKVSSEVNIARKSFDMPPVDNWEFEWWQWSRYSEPRDRKWGPRETPSGKWFIKKNDRDGPLPPPDCWGRY